MAVPRNAWKTASSFIARKLRSYRSVMGQAVRGNGDLQAE